MAKDIINRFPYLQEKVVDTNIKHRIAAVNRKYNI